MWMKMVSLVTCIRKVTSKKVEVIKVDRHKAKGQDGRMRMYYAGQCLLVA
jgi:hypothetical protein